VDHQQPSKIKTYLKSFNFYNVVSFYIVWYLCILGASFHFERSAVLISAGLVSIHYYFSKTKKIDLFYLLIFIFIGFFVDRLFLSFSVLAYPKETLIWNIKGVPLWILMLYVGFSTTMNHSLLFISKRPLASFIFGGIGGAACYQLAAFRGVVDFPLGLLSLAIIGFYWGIFMAFSKPFQKVIKSFLPK
jgi:hypothetical protein